ncbi:phytoene desaturase family protein [Corynebacterium minutissimum]|uniref:Dehydrogenase n=1 Tax=Corynebacterium minutissimum TaxID=38301 RepID=A0A2X4US16_9CORY|nr:NAD(P)/FAD-dependent oxidoreductase [Corynebacterium minutissimum]QPS60265.1 NAD(P)/FAD-dependent oxidoreductase [Corynebacterium minutissimum]QQA78946.1 NAD(P)/FAD-dependent oxidoreductase [Corynebacterium minutissimum]SQI00894.1 dehydrogenase [Corynebacterium minutissimum]VEG05038.1 dehydrogenase [Corynebacterium minutissimum]
MTNAVIVGAGPNGLAAALFLADHDIEVTILEANSSIGGGARSGEYTLPRLTHDHCSAFHPFGVGSSFWKEVELEKYGLEWAWSEVDCAHPLDDGRAGILYRSLDKTVEHLGVDGDIWRKIVGSNVRNFDLLTEDIFRPLLHIPQHPVTLAKFAPYASLPASTLMRMFKTEAGKALFGGIAAHAFTSLDRPLTASLGIMLAAAAHQWGWPVAKGGSGAIVAALEKALTQKNVTIHTNSPVISKRDIPTADLVLLDLSPQQILSLYGDEMPSRIKKQYSNFRSGSSAFKVDYAISGDIPWKNSHCRRAGTVHLGGNAKETLLSESLRAKGKMPSRPFVLVGQQYMADPARSNGNLNPIYAYAHVPKGYSGDATGLVTEQIERFAPGFRDQIVMSKSINPQQMESSNRNFHNGDIIGGENDGLQLVFRPRMTTNPYWVGVQGVYICSHSSPPGAGVHGLCGKNAATAAFRDLQKRIHLSK